MSWEIILRLFYQWRNIIIIFRRFREFRGIDLAGEMEIKKKKNISVLLVSKYSTIAKTQQYLQNRPKNLQLYSKCFSVKFAKFFRTTKLNWFGLSLTYKLMNEHSSFVLNISMICWINMTLSLNIYVFIRWITLFLNSQFGFWDLSENFFTRIYCSEDLMFCWWNFYFMILRLRWFP